MSGAGLCKVKGDVGERPADGLPGAKAHKGSVPVWQECLLLKLGGCGKKQNFKGSLHPDHKILTFQVKGLLFGW